MLLSDHPPEPKKGILFTDTAHHKFCLPMINVNSPPLLLTEKYSSDFVPQPPYAH